MERPKKAEPSHTPGSIAAEQEARLTRVRGFIHNS